MESDSVSAQQPDVTKLIEKRLNYLNQRQAVLAENVANADTPGFKARDLAPLTFDSALKQASVGMTVTDPRHIVPASMSGVNAKTIGQDSTEVLPSGNSVDMEQQMMEVSKTAVDYQGFTALYRSIGNMIKIALKGSTS